MKEFSAIHSLFTLGYGFEELILSAKNSDHACAQEILSDIIYYYLESPLTSFLFQHKICSIFFSPLSKQRIEKSSWHLNEVFKHAIEKIIFRNSGFKDLQIFDCHQPFSSNLKQSSIKSSLRLKKTLDSYYNSVTNTKCTIYFSIYDLNKKPLSGNILFLDDVLTSGETALRFYYDLNKKNLNWYLFSLFRTPIAH
ncbi:MAG: hypothetical protein K2X39_06690 [Silvanigrellaceae bacterium]|nr:hypothetical protein [Silvanigrellaceae bacterium]